MRVNGSSGLKWLYLYVYVCVSEILDSLKSLQIYSDWKVKKTRKLESTKEIFQKLLNIKGFIETICWKYDMKYLLNNTVKFGEKNILCFLTSLAYGTGFKNVLQLITLIRKGVQI